MSSAALLSSHSSSLLPRDVKADCPGGDQELRQLGQARRPITPLRHEPNGRGHELRKLYRTAGAQGHSRGTQRRRRWLPAAVRPARIEGSQRSLAAAAARDTPRWSLLRFSVTAGRGRRLWRWAESLTNAEPFDSGVQHPVRAVPNSATPVLNSSSHPRWAPSRSKPCAPRLRTLRKPMRPRRFSDAVSVLGAWGQAASSWIIETIHAR